ncbi:MAG: tRNA lysidine(34) synthetase TilS, partial [Pseudomonadota bacterium]
MTLQKRFAAEMGRLFAGRRPERLGVACSGGSDSMALLALACAWADGHPRVTAITINHNLRDRAAEEAAFVGRAAKSLGAAHVLSDWVWNRRGNLQDAARRGRHGALLEWQDRTGADAILLGHTADDQAETVLMRLMRGSGVEGLCGMFPEPEKIAPGRRLDREKSFMRPLLGFTRQELRDWLKGRGLAWRDDPSNTDPRFDRAKAREVLKTLAPLGVTGSGLIETANRMKRAREALARRAQDVAGRIVAVDAGDVVFDRSGLAQVEPDTRFRLVAHALRYVSNAAYRPRFASLERLVKNGLAGENGSLHGCILKTTSSDLRICREFRAVSGIAVGIGECWDGRWLICGKARDASAGGATGEIRALGEAGLAQLPDWRIPGVPRVSAMAQPGVWMGETVVAAPTLRLGRPFAAKWCGRL